MASRIHSLSRNLAVLFLAMAPTVIGAINLPIEVVGPDGTTASVTVNLSAGRAAETQSLWMQVHGLSFTDMASVQVNESPWMPLNNQTVRVAEPGRSYGGIGGGFATLKMTLPLAPRILQDGANTIHFRFNRTNGVASGFRVLAWNFLTGAGAAILPPSTFTEEDPNTWKPPFDKPGESATGCSLWHTAALRANGLPNAPPIRAHCADCHAEDGRDLKYFNYSNASIVARSRFHGLSEVEGGQIATYIRGLQVPNPGRPWNPPYQPGPGRDGQPAENWAAGAGLRWVLDADEDALRYLVSGTRITAETFRPDGNLNAREIPIAMQLPDWNHWLPHIHPLDAFGSRFSDPSSPPGDMKDMAAWFEEWTKAQSRFLGAHAARSFGKWTPELAEKIYATQVWGLVKIWEITQERNLEAAGRTWFNVVPLMTAPASAGIPDGPSGMGGSALTNEYFTAAWYELQLLVNSGEHRHRGKQPIDWPYIAAQMLKLYRQSGKPEPARLLVTVIKAMQSTDPKIGPEDDSQGWRPERNIDPRIMVSEEWAPMFQPLTRDDRQALTNALLEAWLDKNFEYRPAEYFHRGLVARKYVAPEELRGITGGRVWEALPQFQAIAVRPDLIKRLKVWRDTSSDLAKLFHY
jgi:hypothetical protein